MNKLSKNKMSTGFNVGNGIFSYVKDLEERNRMQNAHKSITRIRAWDFITNHFTVKDGYDNASVRAIFAEMEKLGYTQHTHETFCRVMRDMHHLATYGEEIFRIAMESREDPEHRKMADLQRVVYKEHFDMLDEEHTKWMRIQLKL